MNSPLASIVSLGNVLLNICACEPCLVRWLAKRARHQCVSILNVKSTGVAHIPIVVSFDRVGSSPVTMLLLLLHEWGDWGSWETNLSAKWGNILSRPATANNSCHVRCKGISAASSVDLASPTSSATSTTPH